MAEAESYKLELKELITSKSTLFPEKSSIMSSSFSPDGSKIALVVHHWKDGSYSLYVMDIDGKNVQKVVTIKTFEWFYLWAPNSKEIIYGGTEGVYKFNLETEEKTLVEDLNKFVNWVRNFYFYPISMRYGRCLNENVKWDGNRIQLLAIPFEYSLIIFDGEKVFRIPHPERCKIHSSPLIGDKVVVDWCDNLFIIYIQSLLKDLDNFEYSEELQAYMPIDWDKKFSKYVRQLTFYKSREIYAYLHPVESEAAVPVSSIRGFWDMSNSLSADNKKMPFLYFYSWGILFEGKDADQVNEHFKLKIPQDFLHKCAESEFCAEQGIKLYDADLCIGVLNLDTLEHSIFKSHEFGPENHSGGYSGCWGSRFGQFEIPVITPDGNHIIFYKANWGINRELSAYYGTTIWEFVNESIWIMKNDGSNRQKLLDGRYLISDIHNSKILLIQDSPYTTFIERYGKFFMTKVQKLYIATIESKEGSQIRSGVARVARGYSEAFNPVLWSEKITENPNLHYWRDHFNELIYNPLDMLYKTTKTEGYNAAATSIKEFITLLDITYNVYFSSVLQEYIYKYIKTPHDRQPYQSFAELAEMIERGENIDSKLAEIDRELANLENIVKTYEPPIGCPPKAKEDFQHLINSAREFIESLKSKEMVKETKPEKVTPSETPTSIIKTPGFETVLGIAALLYALRKIKR